MSTYHKNTGKIGKVRKKSRGWAGRWLGEREREREHCGHWLFACIRKETGRKSSPNGRDNRGEQIFIRNRKR